MITVAVQIYYTHNALKKKRCTNIYAMILSEDAIMTTDINTIKNILSEFKNNLKIYSFEEYIINEKEKVFLIEDSLILYVGFLTYQDCWNGQCWTEYKRNEDYILKIEELTYNNINFKADLENLNLKCIEMTGMSLSYHYNKFFRIEARTLDWVSHKMYIEKSLVNPIDSYLPQLKLFDRISQWQGLKYNFVVMEVSGYNNELGIAVFTTTTNPYSYVQRKCKELIDEGFYWGIGGGLYENFHEALNSWRGKGLKRKKILENNLKYFNIEKYIKDKNKLADTQMEILEYEKLKLYDNIERCSFIKPINKWKTEEIVYKYAKKLYKDYAVVYQHRPYFLRSDKGGQMSYDVFIAKLNIAIEYQGKQHFEPVDFFGGEEGYKKTFERDKLKRKLSEENGVKLIYINYWEDVNSELIRTKIEQATS